MAKKRKTDIFIEDGLVENIEEVDYSHIMSKSFMSYAMSLIISRALPDVRDGLKPVQRRILNSMDELKIYHNTAYKKSARVVGDVMGKYHPHGDSSIYTAQVNMAQDFKRNEKVIDGHGNYGSIEGDEAAAMRYTEARLTKFAKDTFLQDNNKHVVPYIDNYDQSEKEPEVLPAKIPYALLNGADGIAVGMTTAIPPHNLGEIIDALSYTLKTDNPTIKGVMKHMPGPDFATGGIISNKDDLEEIYTNGTGVIKIRGEVDFEPSHIVDKKRVPDALVVKSIPYTMIGEELPKFLKRVEELSVDGTLSDIVHVENHSSGEDIRIVLYLRKNADIEYVKNALYQKTKLESSYGTSFLLVDNKEPVRFSIVELLQRFGEEQKVVYTKRFKYQLEKAERAKEINEGLLKAISIINVIMEIAQGSKSSKQTKECLMHGNVDGIQFKSDINKMIASQLNFSELQADAILRLTISRLVGLETAAIKKDYDELVKEIEQVKSILQDDTLLVKEIIKELKVIKKEYASDRRTALDNIKIKKIEKVKEEVEQVVLVDHFGYAHSISKAVYDKNKEAIFDDFKYAIETTNMKKLFIFTSSGNIHGIWAEKIPSGPLRFKGEPLDNLTNYDSTNETIVGMVSTSEGDDRQLVITTSDGFFKKMDITEINTSRKTTSYIKLNEGAHVQSVLMLEKEKFLVLVTNDNQVSKIDISEVEAKKRTARGGVATKLSEGAIVKLSVFKGDDEEFEFNDKTYLTKNIKSQPPGKKAKKL